MKLVDIEKLEYEPFFNEETGETVDYISAEAIYKAPVIDPVNHAEWEMKKTFHSNGDICIRHICSHCGELGTLKIFNAEAWDAYFKNNYVPTLRKYCHECGYKMDLHELYEQYKRDWCAARGCVLEDVDKLSSINGEIYACFTEWYNNEYMESRGE